MTALYWFTNDLRLADNPGLTAAARDHKTVVPLYLLDDSDPWAAGGASRWWLHKSLASLSTTIAAAGGDLLLRRGDTVQEIVALVKQLRLDAVYFSRAYEPWLARVQQQVHDVLTESGITCKRFGGRLLLEPEQILNKQGKPFQVFTPFYKHTKGLLSVQRPLEQATVSWAQIEPRQPLSDELSDWHLLPEHPNWAEGFESHWQPGEEGAKLTLNECAGAVAEHYLETRDFPAEAGTSQLSPALHFGELSPRQVWYSLVAEPQLSFESVQPLLRQLIWREFNYYLLHHWPHITHLPFKPSFAQFPWQKDARALKAWQQGLTGYPIVDAGMRELWHTGWMHNRVRMVVASFLTKHLQIHWHEGAKWFWDTLVDADLANNSGGWQWVAGSGADAAPYFRIFNPILQGEKFDKDGGYIRKWVPELSALPNKYIHSPWRAPKEVLATAGIVLGSNYPHPIVEHDQARESALFAYRTMSERTSNPQTPA